MFCSQRRVLDARTVCLDPPKCSSTHNAALLTAHLLLPPLQELQGKVKSTVSLYDEAVQQQTAHQTDGSALQAALDVLSLAHDALDAPIDAAAKANILKAADKVRKMLTVSAQAESDGEDEQADGSAPAAEGSNSSDSAGAANLPGSPESGRKHQETSQPAAAGGEAAVGGPSGSIQRTKISRTRRAGTLVPLFTYVPGTLHVIATSAVITIILSDAIT